MLSGLGEEWYVAGVLDFLAPIPSPCPTEAFVSWVPPFPLIQDIGQEEADGEKVRMGRWAGYLPLIPPQHLVWCLVYSRHSSNVWMLVRTPAGYLELSRISPYDAWSSILSLGTVAAQVTSSLGLKATNILKPRSRATPLVCASYLAC